MLEAKTISNGTKINDNAVSGKFPEFIGLHSFHSSFESQSSVSESSSAHSFMSLSDLEKSFLVSHPTAPPAPATTALAPADSPAAPAETIWSTDEVKY